jgi:hypothetical protein
MSLSLPSKEKDPHSKLFARSETNELHPKRSCESSERPCRKGQHMPDNNDNSWNRGNAWKKNQVESRNEEDGDLIVREGLQDEHVGTRFPPEKVSPD